MLNCLQDANVIGTYIHVVTANNRVFLELAAAYAFYWLTHSALMAIGPRDGPLSTSCRRLMAWLVSIAILIIANLYVAEYLAVTGYYAGSCA